MVVEGSLGTKSKNISSISRQIVAARFIEEQNERGRRLVYQFDRPLRYGVRDILGKIYSPEADNIEYRDKCVGEVLQYIPTHEFTLVVISDASTHAERLLFVGYALPKDGRMIYGHTYAQIGGRHTFMIYGGDPSSFKEPEVYLRRLAQVNGYNWGGIMA